MWSGPKGASVQERLARAAEAKKALLERFKKQPGPGDKEYEERQAQLKAIAEARRQREEARERQKAAEEAARAEAARLKAEADAKAAQEAAEKAAKAAAEEAAIMAALKAEEEENRGRPSGRAEGRARCPLCGAQGGQEGAPGADIGSAGRLKLTSVGINPARRARSLRLHARRLDDRPPFLDLGLLERREALGRLLLARRDVEPELGELRLHGRIGEHLRIAPLSLAMTSFGVPFGAKKPNQPDM